MKTRIDFVDRITFEELNQRWASESTLPKGLALKKIQDGACGIYDTRPWVCREYDNDFCEFDESIEQASELFFASPKKLEKYCRKRFKKWDRRFELYE